MFWKFWKFWSNICSVVLHFGENEIKDSGRDILDRSKTEKEIEGKRGEI